MSDGIVGSGTSSDLVEMEQRMLRSSMWAAGVVGLIGVAWGVVSGSRMIVFDGVYALLGIVLTLVAMLAIRVVAAGPSRRFPFGRESLVPLVIGVQGLVLLAVCVYAVIGAVATIQEGGTEVTAGWAIGYAVVSLASSLGMWAWMRPRGARSELVAAEAAQWLATASFGVGMVLGFGAVALLTDTSWARAAVYVDPTMVIVASLVVLPTSFRLIRTMAVELLEGTPPPELAAHVEGIVRSTLVDAGLDRFGVLMQKIGRKLYVEVEVVVQPSFTVAEGDHVRREILRRLAGGQVAVWLNTDFTADPTLFE